MITVSDTTILTTDPDGNIVSEVYLPHPETDNEVLGCLPTTSAPPWTVEAESLVGAS